MAYYNIASVSAIVLVGTVNGRGYDGQQKYATSDVHGPTVAWPILQQYLHCLEYPALPAGPVGSCSPVPSLAPGGLSTSTCLCGDSASSPASVAVLGF